MDKEFCLLDEPWIKVLDSQNNCLEVSLKEVFRNAHLYRQLAGETSTQDAAILRLLLAITGTVLYRYDDEGNEEDVLNFLDPESAILDRWKEYWEKGQFDYLIFDEYLEKYRERFYLFHPQYPFWQVAGLDVGTDYSVINLYGNIKESNNSACRHHFHMRDGESAENISYAEAARWLVYINAYSVNVKTKIDGENKPTGVGRLGQLGLFFVNDDSLFRIILLNLCALNSQGEAWGSPNPAWETGVNRKPGEEIVPPDNFPQICTIQSRRLLLMREGDKINGFRSIGGDYYSTKNDLLEPMTLLQRNKENDIIPKKHRMEIMSWREFSSILTNNKDLSPGLISWISILKSEGCINRSKYITFRMVGLEYGDGMSYTNGDIYDQTLSLSRELLGEKGAGWIQRISEEIQKCEDMSSRVFYSFAKSISENIYRGDSRMRKQISALLSRNYYFTIDGVFRDWLININPESDLKEEKMIQWERQSAVIAQNVVDQYLGSLSPQNLLLASNALARFRNDLFKMYQLKKGGNNA